MRSFCSILALIAGAVACQPTTRVIMTPDAGAQEAGPDAGTPMDAGLAKLNAGTPDAASAQPDAGEQDAGVPDAGVPDAGVSDAGVDAATPDSGQDAGVPDAGEDAGSPVDAGADAGSAPDAGMPDAGAADAGMMPDAGMASCSGKTVTAGDYDWTIMSGGLMRQFHVHVPSQYDPSQATPVVLTFHGLTSTAADIEHQSQMTPVSDANGFIVVYPTGINGAFNAGACCEFTATVDDVGFTSDMIDYLEDQLCVDAKRVYATGLSNGGMMAHRLGCELSNRIAAIAPVAGVLVESPCTPPRAVPVMDFHGMADTIVPYYGFLYPSAPTTVNDWLTIDQCTMDSTVTYQQGDATCVTHTNCVPPNMEVTLCSISDGGHTWPGGDVGKSLGVTSHDINASTYMWTFFVNHPMP